jgi:hypothetical protein
VGCHVGAGAPPDEDQHESEGAQAPEQKSLEAGSHHARRHHAHEELHQQPSIFFGRRRLAAAVRHLLYNFEKKFLGKGVFLLRWRAQIVQCGIKKGKEFSFADSCMRAGTNEAEEADKPKLP